MAVLFTGKEMMKMAVRTEESGYDFYMEAADKSESEDLRGLFRYLAGEEVKHKELYKKLMDSIEDKPQAGLVDQEELDQYIRTMTDSEFFLGGDKSINLAAKAADDMEALKFAIAFEKDTLLFFYQLREMVQKSARDAVDKVIREEKKHIQQLSDMKKSL